MTSATQAATVRFAAFLLAISASGCSLIGFVGGTGVDALRGHSPRLVSPSSLTALPEGSRLTLTLLDSTAVVGDKLRPRPSDYDSAAALTVVRVLLAAKGAAPGRDTLVVPLSQVASASVPVRRTAARTAAGAGARSDLVVLKIAAGLLVAGALIVGIFGLVLTSSGFSF